ncbi:MAG: hypothetical protein HY956_02750 [Deltaproteobacteria bacterium]|nr:hypothetical protein [Deltaproteobacteria bacterium]
MKRNLLIMAVTFVLAAAVIYIKSTIHPPVPEPAFTQGERLVFGFLTSRSDDALFIENTVKEGFGHDALPGDQASDHYKKKGGKVPEGAKPFKIDYDYLKDLVENAPDDGYTAAGGFMLVDLKTEGFYYNTDDACGDDHVTVKLVTDESATGFTEDIVIIKKPHPKLNGFETLVYEKKEIAPELKEKAEAFLKDRLEGLKAESGEFKRYIDNGLVYKGPQLNLYGPKRGAGPVFLSVEWTSEGGESSCCVSGVFAVKDDGLGFDEFLPLRAGSGLKEITKVFRLSGREFVFVTAWFWEGSSSAIYEYRDKAPGRLYQESRPRGGC